MWMVTSASRCNGKKTPVHGKEDVLKYDAVLFDCDGVLVDSEPITLGVLRDRLQDLGWTLSLQECMHHFMCKSVMDEVAVIRQYTGHTVDRAWLK